MNYTGFHLTQLSYNDFIKGIEQQYGIKWAPVQLKIYQMLRQTFEAATIDDDTFGFGGNYQSRAFYAIDMMLDKGFVCWRKYCRRNCRF